MMYRRYHLKKVMADGTKRDVVEWRRRVIDEQGKVRFVKEDLAHVGTGVYRSARQNALRLTITETNMAYNYANCERWSSKPYYQENCQSCVVVHEARLRGLDITALGYSGKKDSVQYQLGEHFEDAWINPKTGKVPSPTIIKGDALLSKAERQMQAVGRYHVGINYDVDNGHIIVVDRLQDGKLVLYDPQNGNFVSLNEFDNVECLEILKIDKLLIRKDFITSISETL